MDTKDTSNKEDPIEYEFDNLLDNNGIGGNESGTSVWS